MEDDNAQVENVAPEPVAPKRAPAVKHYCQWEYIYTPKAGMKCNKWIKLYDKYKNQYPQVETDLCHYHINQHLNQKNKQTE